MGKVLQFGPRTTSGTGHPVQRRELSTEPFTAQQRETIFNQFHKLHYDVQRIATCFGVGHKAVQRVLRFEYWRLVGRRKADRIATQEVRAIGRAA